MWTVKRLIDFYETWYDRYVIRDVCNLVFVSYSQTNQFTIIMNKVYFATPTYVSATKFPSSGGHTKESVIQGIQLRAHSAHIISDGIVIFYLRPLFRQRN